MYFNENLTSKWTKFCFYKVLQLHCSYCIGNYLIVLGGPCC